MMDLRDAGTGSPQHDHSAATDFGRTVVSVYQNTYDVRGIMAPLSSVIRRVRSGAFGLKGKTLRARSLSTRNKTAYRTFKGSQLPAFTPAGVFSKRNGKELVSHSGLLVLDYDDIETQNLAQMKALAADAAHTAAAFISPSGNGVKVLVAVEPKPSDGVTHTEAWRAAAARYDELLSGTADSSGKDLPRLTLLAHDASAYLAEEITPLAWEPSSQSTQRSAQPSRNGSADVSPGTESTNGKNVPVDELAEALRHVPPDDYETWLLVGMAIHHDGGDVSQWEAWSRSAPSKYEMGACERKWQTFTAGGGITLGTVYELAKRNGWKGKAPRDRRKNGWTEAQTRELPYSDAYNADLFAQQHGKDFCWVDDNNHWLYWTGKRWSVDRHSVVYEKMKATITGLSAGAESMTDNDAAGKLFKHIASSLSQAKIRAALESARGLLAAVPEDFDTKGYLFNCANGTIDLRDGSFREQRREDLLTRHSGFEWKGLEHANEEWNRFMEQIQPDAEVREFLQRAAGYSATDSVREECLLYLYGEGANGKSTFIESIWRAMGSYCQAAMAGAIQRGEGQYDNSTALQYAVADMKGARMVVHDEVESGARLAESFVKKLTGGDTRKGRHPYAKRAIEYRPTDTPWLYGNHKLEIRGADEGIWRRIHLVNFTERFEGAGKNDRLKEYLTSNADIQSAILAWIVRGAMRWYADGLKPPDAVRRATEEYRRDQDDIGRFIETFCFRREDAYVRTSDLYECYETRFEGTKSKNAFGRELTRRGFEIGQRRTGGAKAKVRLGIGLL
ncbi:MAG: phage/plasmid primase, P4 family [Candidatus Poribacteria bacterium]|nr:phage/plasmid primase, P4 family [Candidatus Poribacteria bacterium]